MEAPSDLMSALYHVDVGTATILQAGLVAASAKRAQRSILLLTTTTASSLSIMSTTQPSQISPSAPATQSKAAGTKTKASGPQPTQNSVMSTVKSKKDSPRPSNTTSTMSAPSKPPSQGQMKKVSRRASKPIINWLQRKLAGTVRARRASESQRYGAPSPRGKSDKQHRRSSVPVPPPPLSIHSRTRSNATRPRSLHGTISLNESNDDADSRSFGSVSDDGVRSSVARESLYSPASFLEADEDASVRPLPPSSPPSPVPSRDSSSYLSHSRTFRSMTASTKPTTLLSVDLTGGMAHIAQAPPTPTTPGHRIPPHIRTHSAGPSAGSITFSAFHPSSPSNASRPSSGNSTSRSTAALTAPLYTSHHPRNNPRPSSPPPDDASVLTLASSAFGMPGARIGVSALALSGRGSIADDSISQWSHAAALTDSASHFMLMGDVEEGLEERYMDHDVDASVRALRPRSSRRGSWDSTVSGWSANVALGGGGSSVAAPSPGGARSKSMWASGSFRTGGMSTEEALVDGFAGEREDEEDGGKDDKEDNETAEGGELKKTDGVALPAPADSVHTDAATVDSSPTDQGEETRTSLTAAAAAAEGATVATLPGSKAEIPTNAASTVTPPGSKTGLEIPSPEDSLVNDPRSIASTPTKTVPAPAEPSEVIASPTVNSEGNVAQPQAAQGSQDVPDPKDTPRPKDAPIPDAVVAMETKDVSAPLSPASATQTEYLSAPSTPATA